jgi:RNA polymerase sigma factor for flagellar operon FliA
VAGYQGDASKSRDQILSEVIASAHGAAWHAYQRAPDALDLDELYALALFGIAQADARYDRYCHENGYDSGTLTHYRVYLGKRMNGAIADHLRQSDWMTRAARTAFKRISAACPGGLITDSQTDAELAERSGLTVAEVHDARVAFATRPVSLDDRPPGSEDHLDPPAPENTESAAIVSEILEAAAAAVRALPPVQAMLVILRYVHDMEVSEMASAAGIDAQRAGAELEAAILAVHAAMVRAASG